MTVDDDAFHRPGFWSTVRLPRGEAVVIAAAAVGLVVFVAEHERSVTLLGIGIAYAILAGMATAWVLCRVLVAWIKWPSRSRWTRWLKEVVRFCLLGPITGE